MLIVVWLIVLAAAFYFIIVRPQRRQSQLRRQLIATIGLGDEIVTSGGIIATVVALGDETLDVEIAPGVVVKIARGAVAAKTNPPYEAPGAEGDDEEFPGTS